MEKKVVMTIKRFMIEEACYKMEPSQIKTEEISVTLNPVLVEKIKKINTDIAEVRVTCKLNQEDLPFSVKVVVCGVFESKDWEDTQIGTIMMSQNAFSILYPYVRATITQLTAMSPFSQCVLPIINVEAAMKSGRIKVEKV